jgi:hypothetical protein
LNIEQFVSFVQHSRPPSQIHPLFWNLRTVKHQLFRLRFSTE